MGSLAFSVTPLFLHMNRIERLHAITTVLQSKRIVKAEELSRKFEVSLRTIYRDIRSLEAGGMPIGAEAGIGYFLIDGYHLPPIMFTKEEGRSLIMAGKLMEKISDPSVNVPFQAALTKVRAVLDNEKKDDLQGLEESIIVNPFPDQAPSANNAVLDKIKEGIIRKNVLEIEYFSNYKGEATKRHVESIGLTFYGNHWHLIGYCQLRHDYRDFRTDRMGKVSVLSERFQPFRHPSLQEYIDRMFQDTDLQQVVIKVHESIFRFITDTKYNMGLVHENLEGEYWKLTFASSCLNYFARWLLLMLDKVEVVEPKALQENIQNMVLTLNTHYQHKL